MRSGAQKMHSKKADRLNEEELLKLKGIAERNRESWLRTGQNMEAIERLSVILASYSISDLQEVGLIDGAQELRDELRQKNGPCPERAEQEKNTPKVGLLEKCQKKTSEKLYLH